MFFLPVLAVACSLSSARAGELVSPEGFTLTYPEEWKPATKEQLAKIVEATKKLTGADPGMAAFISGPPSEEFAPNVNVIALKSPLPVNPTTEKQMVKQIKDRFAAQGAAGPEIKSKQINVDGHAMLSVAYEQDNPVAKKTLRTWTVIFPGKNGACILTCTALKSQWADAGPVFTAMINSLKLEGVPKE
jgi:hypothetical protein